MQPFRYLRILAPSLVAYLLLFWFAGPAGIVLLPLLTALLIYILHQEVMIDSALVNSPEISKSKKRKGKSKSKQHSKVNATKAQLKIEKSQWLMTLLVLGGVTGFLGGLLAVLFLTQVDLETYLQRMPAIVNQDITPSLYRTLYDLVAGNNRIDSMGAPAFVFLTTLLTGGFCFGLGFIRKEYKKFVSCVLVVLICLVFVTTVFQATGEFRQAIAQEPPEGYAYDAVIYLKVFYLIADQGYYSALVEAYDNDARAKSKGATRDGKFYKLTYSPFWFRTPVVFYFWRLLTFGNAVGILYLSIISGFGLIVLSYLAGKSLIGEPGVFLSIALVPYLIMGSIWWNLLFPDWWAALALTAGILFWLCRQYWPAAGAFLVAAAFRELIALFLLLFLVLAFVHKKEARFQFGLAAGIFGAVYPLHYFKAKGFISPSVQEIGSVIDRLTLSSFIPTFIPTSSYQNFPYGFFLWPAFLMMLVAVAVWAWKKRYDMLALSILAFPYFGYASSTYWGQHLMPFIIFSAFMVFLLGSNERGEDTRISKKRINKSRSVSSKARATA